MGDQIEPRLPGELTETSYWMPPDTTFERWSEVGGTLTQIHQSLAWWMGDWWLHGERTYGEAAAQAAPTGYRSETLRKAAWVCDRIPPEDRRPELSFSAHARVAGLETVARATILDRAVAEGWTSREVAAAAREFREPEPEPEPPVESLPWEPDTVTEAFVSIPRAGLGGVADMVRRGEVEEAVSILETWRDWTTD